jgi:hypothetical protein
MKAAHLKKVEERRKRVTETLLPPDRVDRVTILNRLISNLTTGRLRGTVGAGRAQDLQRLLETDIPELVLEITLLKAELRRLARDSWYLNLEAEAAQAAELPEEMSREVA